MKPEIGLMGQLMTENVLDDLDFVIKNDFDWFEVGLDWKQNFDLSENTLKKIKKRANKDNIKLIVHTPWYLQTSTILPEVKKGVLNVIRKNVDIAKKIKADRLTIHPGYREMPGPAIDLNYESLIETLKETVKICRGKNIDVCFENFDKSPGLIGVELKDYKKVLNSVEGLKTTLDIGHANTSKTKSIKYLESVKDTIMDMHVHDNNGKKDQHKCLGEGNIDFVRLFKNCKEISYNGPFILELFPYKNILKGKKRFLELWEEA